MPKLTKSFTLQVSVEEFLRECSLLELQALEISLSGELARREKEESLLESKREWLANRSKQADEKQAETKRKFFLNLQHKQPGNENR